MTAAGIRIGIIGFGKIARDQHMPAIAGNGAFQFAGAVTRGAAEDILVPVFADYHNMLREVDLDAVAICTPALVRYAIARDCLNAGKHVLLEKPPASTLGEIAELQAQAVKHQRTLFTTWHAQSNAGVVQAAEIAHHEGVASLEIEWMEDVEKWHPGQDWIWGPGGFGVFDAGINALSIATRICPDRLLVGEATMMMHVGAQQPIAADVSLHSSNASGPMFARFDWRHKGDERWNINVTTHQGSKLALTEGGRRLQVNGELIITGDGGEYPLIYSHFGSLIESAKNDVDAEPLRLTSDIFLSARRIPASPE